MEVISNSDNQFDASSKAMGVGLDFIHDIISNKKLKVQNKENKNEKDFIGTMIVVITTSKLTVTATHKK